MSPTKTTSGLRRLALPLGTLLLALLTNAAFADMNELRGAWDDIMYRGEKDAREGALEKLAEQARQEVASHPEDADLLIWRGIILSTYAGEHGGIGALSLAKEARDSLEQALEIAPNALDGSAYTSLGSLYYKVPGWPIGFGDHKKAREYLNKALEINPKGIDPNFFMGDLLIQSGDHNDGRRYLEAALAAPDRPGRALADEGRRGEIRTLLANLDKGG